MFLRWLVAGLAMLASGTAQAAWQKASSRHFIIYSEQKPQDLRAFADRLERFDQASRKILRMPDPPVGDGNRLSIFVLPSVEAVRKIKGGNDRFVYGFYVPKYSGSVAFTPRRTEGGPLGLQADTVLFHEYSHHLMMQQFSTPYPNWYVEGFAELLSTAQFGKDGSVTIGTAPVHRARSLFSDDGLSTRQMLESQPARLSQPQRESIYARGWLLTHYLSFEPSRAGQLTAYVENLAKGQTSAVAATNAFGDLKLLDKELNSYIMRRNLRAISVSGSSLSTGAIDIAPLSVGANEAMQWRMQTRRSTIKAGAIPIEANLRSISARYPGDPMVQSALAEAELDVDAPTAALAAADAALAANPREVEAMIYKGRALAALALHGDKAGSFEGARAAFLAANKIDTEDPEPLFLFFQSFVQQHRTPTVNALAALHYASTLAPQDTGLRVTSAMAWLHQQRFAEARADLLPIAYDPHGGMKADKARAALDRIDAKDAPGALAALVWRD